MSGSPATMFCMSHTLPVRKQSRGAISRSASQQRGYTMIELLIGLIISLFVGGIAITYMLASSQSMMFQSSENRIQENTRLVFELMASTIRLAASNQSSDPQVLTSGIFAQTICDSSSNCNANSLDYDIKSLEAGESDKTIDSDRLAVDYVTDDTTTCTGSVVTTEKKIVTVYFVDDLDDDGIASLYCQAYESELDVITLDFTSFTTPFAATALIDGVDSLQVQYGVDTDSDGDIDIYRSYNNLPAADHDKVRALKLGMLVSSGQTLPVQLNTEADISRTYRVFDASITADDGVLRQSVATTVYIPNMAGGS